MDYIEIMKELTEETGAVLKEVLDEEIKPLIAYRAQLERKLANTAIKEMYELEKSEV